MTLDEAIKHCEEKAKELREKAIVDYENNKTTLSEFADCRECASEHAQLAEWLKELKALKGGAEMNSKPSFYNTSGLTDEEEADRDAYEEAMRLDDEEGRGQA